jgi:hypothetical protein
LYVTVTPDHGHVDYQIFNPDGSSLLDLISTHHSFQGQLWPPSDRTLRRADGAMGVSPAGKSSHPRAVKPGHGRRMSFML